MNWHRLGSAMVALFIRFGAQFLPAPAGGGRPRGGGGPSPGEVLPGLPWDRVLILMLLHSATAVVCIVLLTTLTREPARGVHADARGRERRLPVTE